MSSFAKVVLRGVTLGSALLLASQAVACDRDAPITIVADRQELSAVVEMIAQRCNFDVVFGDRLSTVVNVDYRHRPTGEVLRRILRRHSYILESNGDGQLTSLRILGGSYPQPDGGPDRFDHTRSELTDANPEIRLDAVLDILDQERSDDEARHLVEASLYDHDASVREAAAAVLEAMAPVDQSSK